MIARKRLHIIVIALCLWLPLQAIAGQWLHCAKMESALSDKKNTVEKSEITSSHSCHQAPDNQASTDTSQASIDSDQTSTESANSHCNHCQFVCHWHCVILLADLIPFKIEFSQDYSPLEVLSPVQPVLATPQRPPQAWS
jgi:hypothetical protein